MYNDLTRRGLLWSAIAQVIGVILPWISFDLITKISINGFATSSGKVILVLGILAVVTNLFSNNQLRFLVSGLVGLLSLVLLYFSYRSMKVEAGDLSVLVDVIPWRFGLYLTVFASFALLLLGAYGFIKLGGFATLKQSKELDLFGGFIYNVVNRKTEAVEEVAATSALEANAIKPNLALLRTVKGKIVVGIAIVLVSYLISIPVYNSMHSSSRTLDKLAAAVKEEDSGTVRKLLVDQNGKGLTLSAAKAFASYYNKHLDQFNNVIRALENDSNNINKVWFGTTSTDGLEILKHSTFGFVSYTVKVQTAPIMVSSLKGSLLRVNDDKENIEATGNPQSLGNYVSQLPVPVTATYKSQWGDVSQTADTQAGGSTQKFDFIDKMVAVDDKDMPTGLAILVDGKDSGVKTGSLKNGDLPMIGPLPSDKALTISITAKEPFGDLTFSASTNDAKYKQIKLVPDYAIDKQVLADVAQVIDKFNTAFISKGNVMPYLVPGSPIADRFNNKVTPTENTYQKMIEYNNSLKIVNVDGKPGVKVNNNETYGYSMWGTTGTDNYKRQYTMLWNPESKQWQIYNTDSYYGFENQGSQNDVVITH